MKNGTHATTVGRSLKSTLKAINDYVIVEEDPIELTRDDNSGLNKDVVEAIKNSKLVLPDIGEYMANKFPMRGVVLDIGPKAIGVSKGDRVMFARMGGQRWQKDGKQYVTLHISDIHAILT